MPTDCPQRDERLGWTGDIAVYAATAAAQFDVADFLHSWLLDLAAEAGEKLEFVSLADTMAWASPLSIRRVVGAIRDRYPDLTLSLHLHDTRGMGIANVYSGLQMGVEIYDAAVAGLGGCPFAAHKGAAGNVCLGGAAQPTSRQTRAIWATWASGIRDGANRNWRGKANIKRSPGGARMQGGAACAAPAGAGAQAPCTPQAWCTA